MRALRKRLTEERTLVIVRWWIVGIIFLGLTIPTLYLLHDQLGLPLPLATLLAGELLTVIRFGVNDRWVFGNARPTWRRLIEYHAAVISSSLIWWTVTNLLPLVGVHYLIASLFGTVASVGWSMVTNFLWVWRPKASSPVMLEATLGAAGPTAGVVAGQPQFD
jgi:putative flippase GtrA